MKNKFLTLTAICAVLISACTKDVITAKPGDEIAGGPYQSFTRDSHWDYRTTLHIPGNNNTEVGNSTITMTSGLYYMDNKTFHKANSVTGTDNEVAFFGYNDHIYSIRQVDDVTGESFTLPYLNPDVAAGVNWVTPVTVPGNPAQIQLKTTIVEKGISKTIQGKTYTDVIHSRVDIQYAINNTYQTQLTYDFYVAKNVGMIGIYAKTSAGPFTDTELTGYVIK